MSKSSFYYIDILFYIEHLRRSGYIQVAERLCDLADIDDVEMRLDSVQVAMLFLCTPIRALSGPAEIGDRVGMDYPAVWLSDDGHIRLLWEREDQSLSVIVTCLTEGLVRVESFEGDDDTTRDMPYHEAVAWVRAFVSRIRGA